MINEACLLGCAETRTCGGAGYEPHAEQLLPLVASQVGKQGRLGGGERKPWPSAVSQPSPGHSQVPPGAHEQTEGLSKRSCCASGGQSLGLPREAQGPHRRSPAVAPGAFPTLTAKTKPAPPACRAPHARPHRSVSTRSRPQPPHSGPRICGVNGRVQGPQPHSTCPWVPPPPARQTSVPRGIWQARG